MSIAEKLSTVAENVPKVYEAGQKSERDRFWDEFIPQSGLGYAAYYFAGYGWCDDIFQPNKDIVLTNNSTGLFRQSGLVDIKGCLERCGVTLDTSGATVLSSAFGYGHIKCLPKISLVSASNKIDYIFAETLPNTHMVSIDEVEVAETNTFKGSFNYCDKLEHVIFTGTLATNGLDVHWSTLLDRESLLSILNILQDKTSAGGTWTVTLGTENLAKLTDAEKAVATQKGWTLV